jgi:hypothetical protein
MERKNKKEQSKGEFDQSIFYAHMEIAQWNPLYNICQFKKNPNQKPSVKIFIFFFFSAEYLSSM